MGPVDEAGPPTACRTPGILQQFFLEVLTQCLSTVERGSPYWHIYIDSHIGGLLVVMCSNEFGRPVVVHPLFLHPVSRIALLLQLPMFTVGLQLEIFIIGIS